MISELNNRINEDGMKQDRKLFDDPELDKIVKEIRRRHVIDKIDYKRL